MEAAGVRPGDSRDEKGRPRFFPFIPADVVVPKTKNLDYWYWENLAHDHEQVGIIHEFKTVMKRLYIWKCLNHFGQSKVN